MTKDQSESTALETEMEKGVKKSLVDCSHHKTANGNDSQALSPDSNKESQKSSTIVELVQENQKTAETEQESPKNTETEQESRKITETVQEIRKNTESVQESRKNMETVQESRKNTETVQESQKNTETVSENEKGDKLEGERKVEKRKDEKMVLEVEVEKNQAGEMENNRETEQEVKEKETIDQEVKKTDFVPQEEENNEKLTIQKENIHQEEKSDENWKEKTKNNGDENSAPITDVSEESAPITSDPAKNEPIPSFLINLPIESPEKTLPQNPECQISPQNSPKPEISPPEILETSKKINIESKMVNNLQEEENESSLVLEEELTENTPINDEPEIIAEIITEINKKEMKQNLQVNNLNCEENLKGHGVKCESPIMMMTTTAKRKEIEEEEEEFKAIEDEPKFIVGIVGEPTAVTELINDDELGTESTLPTDDHVARWVENTANVDNANFSDGERENHEDEQEEEVLEIINERKIKRNDTIELSSSRKRRKIVNHIIKRSIKCLNKMHAMDENSSVVANTKNMKATEKKEDDDFSRQSPQVPQNQQNGAALPEETVTAATERLHSSTVKEEPLQDTITDLSKKSSSDLSSLTKHVEDTKIIRSDERASRKRRSTDEIPSANGNANTKRICLEQREQLVSSLITGYENASADELATRADCLRAELQALDELARAAEMEWNRVLTMRKLKEEAYLRVERRRQVVNFMEGHDRLNDLLPSMNSAHDSHDWEAKKLGNIKEKCAFPTVRGGGGVGDDEQNILYKNNSDKISKSLQQTAQNLSNRLSADARKQAADLLGDNRQIGEGRQGPTVDVRSIIADYRLRHPESVPRRGRRMRNSVNVNLGAGGAVMENNQNTDSRPSSTDSCKSNSNIEGNNSLNFKDVLVHFAKLSQQQGEPVKTPQNYPDVTLHPVAPSPPTTQNSTPQPSGSLLHGILTKAQSPRPTTFSPTLARLLTAPERDRSAPVTTVTPHSNSASQRMIQAYQEANPVSISELLSSSKGRTEITITPVVNALVPPHANNMMQVDDEEESSIMEERESRISGGSRDDRDISPRCQGCHERAAQYVCAGCGNQWYCSPECQAAAWDEHSEVCSG
ncbi:trichohyalin-like isoform X2 [Leptopilina heterotoma]|uniref:trichohyalin-like isoform X2 n=1 Tax=Leptopilina heterotoma TaxID=63436 RepID=UPI001CA83044|nr:trichohyalin-like isoform X2 [Leptopilina heterotoma]